jgi:hypothetical protein
MKLHKKIVFLLSLFLVAGGFEKALASQTRKTNDIEIKYQNTLEKIKQTEESIKNFSYEIERLEIAIEEKYDFLKELEETVIKEKNEQQKKTLIETIEKEKANLVDLEEKKKEISNEYIGLNSKLFDLDSHLHYLMERIKEEEYAIIRAEEQERLEKQKIYRKEEEARAKAILEKNLETPEIKTSKIDEQKAGEPQFTISELDALGTDKDGELDLDRSLGPVLKSTLNNNLATVKARKEKLAELSTSVNLNKPDLLETRKKLFEEIQNLRTAIEKIRSKYKN